MKELSSFGGTVAHRSGALWVPRVRLTTGRSLPLPGTNYAAMKISFPFLLAQY